VTNQCAIGRCAGLAALSFLLLCTTPAGGAAQKRPQAFARVRIPLAVRVQRILGMKAGHNHYLAAYRECVAVLHAAAAPQLNGSTGPVPYYEGLAQNIPLQRAVNTITDAFKKGADATALRDVLLSGLTLTGQCIGTASQPWRFGQTFDRMRVAAYFEHLARVRLAAHGRVAASMYARVSLILQCQDPVFGGAASWINFWFSEHPTFPQWRVNSSTLDLTVAQRARLVELARSAVNRRRWFSAVVAAPLWSDGKRLLAVGSGPLPAKLVASYAGTLTTALSQSRSSLRRQYNILRFVGWPLRSLAVAGHRNAIQAVMAVLKNQAAMVADDKRLPILDRHVLLRWIKEASL